MTGFLGQKFDFVGRDGEWYAVVSDMPGLEVNMRVTSPVPAEPEITYITGLGIKTIDNEGLDHSIVITVTDPHSLDTTCPVEGFNCLADGALTVELDGKRSSSAPTWQSLRSTFRALAGLSGSKSTGSARRQSTRPAAGGSTTSRKCRRCRTGSLVTLPRPIWPSARNTCWLRRLTARLDCSSMTRNTHHSKY
ncbi:unnamed protein product [Ectocarpus sp. 12 AP-2014]